MKSFAEFKENINEAQMKMSYREWLAKTGKTHSPENVELYKKTQTEEVELDEAKRPISKEDIIKLLVKYGNNPVSAKRMVDKEFEYAIKTYPDATASKIAEIIRIVSEENQMNEVELDEKVVDPDYIQQYLADKDINSKVEGKIVKVHSSDVASTKKYLKKAGYRDYKVVGGLNEVYEDGTQLSEEKHRVLVSVSDPHHQMVSRRKELIQRHVRVSAASKDDAIAKAKAFYKKKGYRVHDAEHVGSVNEENLELDEFTDKVVDGLNEAYVVTLHHTYPDGKKEQFQYTIKSATSNKHAARIARLIHVKKNIPAKLISFEPSKDVKLIEHSELEESRGHKILSTALSRMNTRKKIASGEIKVGVTRDEPSTRPTDEKKDKSEVKTVKETNDMLTYSEFVAMLDEGKADDIKDLLAAMREKRLSSYDFSKEKDEKKSNRTVYRSKKYGNGDEDDVESKSETQSTVKRGRGRPKGSKSGARV